MRNKLDLENWNRKDHFNFFNGFEEPFFGVTVDVDCTKAYKTAKDLGVSFFQYYLHKSIVAANEIILFRYRIIDNEIWEYDKVDASAVITREDGTFGFSYIKYDTDFAVFSNYATEAILEVQQSTGLKLAGAGENVIHCSAMPWLNFTALSHARNYSYKDSCPKFSYGKIKIDCDKKIMPFSVHVNHALMDGVYVAQIVERFQDLLNS
ncbi:MAG: chloramphenicol acetyltransferase [Chitinophagaceae bacterium]|nr:MAG: chloramphenicol acetyltransferase [Chitinophagaceae bacterium]